MFIRFFSGEVDDQSHLPAGLFCAAYDLMQSEGLPDYELDALIEITDWFDVNLVSPFEYWPGLYYCKEAISWFKSTAGVHLTRAWELVGILERNGISI